MRTRIKTPIWVVTMLVMTACMLISAAVTTYVAKETVERTLYSLAEESVTVTGRYPDWFTEWQNTVYLKEQMEE